MPDDFIQPPMPVTPAATDPSTASLARIGLLGIACAAIVAAALLVVGSTFAPTRTLAGDETGGEAGGAAEAEAELELGHGAVFGRAFGHIFGVISITAIDGTAISLETEDGWTRTITVDDGTEYTRSGDEITLADLAVGDRVAFRQTLEDDGTWTIDALVVILPHAGGEIVAIDGSTISVERRDGETSTINVTDETEIRVNGDDATLADIEVGMVLIAEGTENADGSLTATRVRAAEMGELFERGPRFGARPFDGPGRHGRGFGPALGFGFGFDVEREGDEGPDATDKPADATAS